MNHEQEVRTAYHEAGHSVVAVKLFSKFVYVTIRENENSFGRVRFRQKPKRVIDCLLHRGCPRSRVRELETREFCEKQIIIGFAGRIAEEKYSGHTVEQGHEDDYELVQQGIVEFGGDKIPPNTGQIPLHIQEVYRQWLLARSKHMVDSYWSEVDAVAQALIKRERLIWKDVLRIMDEAAQVKLS